METKMLVILAFLVAASTAVFSDSSGGDPNYCGTCVTDCAQSYSNNPEWAESCMNNCVSWCTYCTSKGSCNACPQGGMFRCAWNDNYGCLPCPGATCISDCGYVPFPPNPTPVRPPAITPTPSQAVCDRHQASCTNCTYYAGCGWSISQSKCLVGNGTRSDDLTSKGIDWVWASGSCPESCPAHATCGNCTGYGGCGWSASQQSCMHGDADGSDSRNSNGSDWAWKEEDCSGAAPPMPIPCLPSFMLAFALAAGAAGLMLTGRWFE